MLTRQTWVKLPLSPLITPIVTYAPYPLLRKPSLVDIVLLESPHWAATVSQARFHGMRGSLRAMQQAQPSALLL